MYLVLGRDATANTHTQLFNVGNNVESEKQINYMIDDSHFPNC